ncbi:hypothetical protein [Qipengyuania psychrotolerans]|uniref:Uncharacterized protein n=1 Tax=Qipengyuania psychrotolerans TaxID=2867238 RepID=A0ABX8ZAY1_9SPHN|nr:hypothetical protein [Qipengyuania psychrotolerans]QZD86151.1 hypothetical protein K3166_07645 [Qipengyuania psychrotolerans]
MKILAVKRSRMIWIAAFALLAVLVVAWIDGGEEPIRPIAQPLEMPEGSR